MSRFSRLLILGLAILVASASSVWAQSQYIGYVFPAGGQQGNTFPIKLGGQRLLYASDVVVSGEGVTVRVVDYFRVWNNQERTLLSQQLAELKKKETVLGDVMAAKMAWFEFPATIGPEKEPAATDAKDAPEPSEKELAKKNLIDRINRLFA